MTEFAGNVSGGTQAGRRPSPTRSASSRYRLADGWPASPDSPPTSIIVNRSGSNDSPLFGDNLLPVQEIYGSGGDVAVHLVSAYAQEKLSDGALDIAAGRMNVENDFASSPLYCNFMNNGLCGDPKALPGGDHRPQRLPGRGLGRPRARPPAAGDLRRRPASTRSTSGLYSYAN